MFKNVEFEIWFPTIVPTISWYKMAQIIIVRTFLNVELSGLHQNIQNFYPRCSGS